VLELRPGCECCDRDLTPEATDAMICSFECTWCAECAQALGVCPNCGGNFTPRPIRPVAELIDNPASTVRVFNPDCRSLIDAVGAARP
jgi:hypothetical protein